MNVFNETSSMEALYVIASMTESTKWYFEMQYLCDIIKDPKLENNIILDSSNYDDYEVFEKYRDSIYGQITSQMSTTLMDALKECPIDISEFIDYFARNSEDAPNTINEKDIVDLMIHSSSKVFLEAWSMDEELNLSQEAKDRIKARIEELEEGEKGEKAEDDFGYEVSYGHDEDEADFIASQYFDKLNIIIATLISRGPDKEVVPDPLEYTQDEIDAINTYGGKNPGGSYIAEQQDAYHLLNVLMYPGIQGEVEKFFLENKNPRSPALQEPDALVECYRNIISAMVKYSLQMTDTLYTRRVDRNLAVDLIKENDSRTVSFFSTSLHDFDENFAVSKTGVALEEAVIRPGTLCIEFEDILREDYAYAYEAEVLVAPFAKGEVEEIPLETDEFGIKDKNGEPPQRKVRIEFDREPQREASKEELEETEEAYKIINDSKVIRNAKAFLDAMKIGYSSGMTFEEYKKNIDEELIADYLKYKGALQTIVKSIIREKTLEITQALEEYEKENGPINGYRAANVYGEGKPVITGRDLRDLAETQTPDQIFTAVDNSTRVLGVADKDDRDKKGKQHENK